MLHVFLGVACHMFFGGVEWYMLFGEWNVICFLFGATLAQVSFASLLSSPPVGPMAGLQKAFFWLVQLLLTAAVDWSEPIHYAGALWRRHLGTDYWVMVDPNGDLLHDEDIDWFCGMGGVYVHFAHWACGFVYLEAGVVFAPVLCTE